MEEFEISREAYMSQPGGNKRWNRTPPTSQPPKKKKKPNCSKQQNSKARQKRTSPLIVQPKEGSWLHREAQKSKMIREEQKEQVRLSQKGESEKFQSQRKRRCLAAEHEKEFCSQKEWDYSLKEEKNVLLIFACIPPKEFFKLRQVCKSWRTQMDKSQDLRTFKYAFRPKNKLPPQISGLWSLRNCIPVHRCLRIPPNSEELIYEIFAEATCFPEMMVLISNSWLSFQIKSEVIAYLLLSAKCMIDAGPEKSATLACLETLQNWWYDYGIRFDSKKFVMTDEQIAIEASAIRQEPGQTMLVSALAGCGKTSTLKLCAQRLFNAQSYVYFAFNRAIADEAEESKKFVKAKTLDSISWHYIKNDRPDLWRRFSEFQAQLEEKMRKQRTMKADQDGSTSGVCFARNVKLEMTVKLLEIDFKVEISREDRDENDDGKPKYRDLSLQAAKVVQLILEYYCWGADAKISNRHSEYFVKQFLSKMVKNDRSFEPSPHQYFLKKAKKLWEISKSPRSLHEYEHSSLGWNGAFKLMQLDKQANILRLFDLPASTTICIDEAQDLTRCQYSFVKRHGGREARHPVPIIFVGDPHQAIYGWKGAHGEPFKLWNRPQLCHSLTRTFRMGFFLCSLANYVLNILEPNSANRLFGKAERDYVHRFRNFTETPPLFPLTVIGRTKGSLVKSAYDAFGAGLKVDITMSAAELGAAFKESLFKDLFTIWLDSKELSWQDYGIKGNYKKQDKELQNLKLSWLALKDAIELMGRKDVGMMMGLIESFGEESPQVLKKIRVAFTRNPSTRELNYGLRPDRKIFHDLTLADLESLQQGDERGPVVATRNACAPVGSHLVLVLEEGPYNGGFKPMKQVKDNKLLGEELITYLRKQLTQGLQVIVKFAQLFYTTTHKAKGCEFDNVLLLDDFGWYEDQESLKSKFKREEMNILYVAITRTKKHLYMNSKVEEIYDELFPSRITPLRQPITGEQCFQCQNADQPLLFKRGQHRFCSACAADQDALTAHLQIKQVSGKEASNMDAENDAKPVATEPSDPLEAENGDDGIAGLDQDAD